MSFSLAPTPCVLWRRRHVEAATGLSRSTLYVRVHQKLLTPPVSIGPRAVGWPQAEIEAINRARVAGVNDEALRALVIELVAQRTAGGTR